METIHSLLSLDFILRVFSSLSLALSLLNEVILDALIGINQIEAQTRLQWQRVMLVSSLPKLGDCPEAQIARYFYTRFSSRPLAWLVKFVLKSVCYAPFLQQSVK